MFGFELDFLKLLERSRTELLNRVFEIVTMLGEEMIIIVLMAIIYYVYDKKLAHRIFYITMVSLSVNGIIKNFAKVPRPWASGEVTCVRPDTATGYSFPSGHTQNFATWSMALAVYLKKKWLMILSVVFSVLVAFSRMFLGAHYPSDVAVGLLLGFGFAFLGNYIYDRVENKNLLYGLSTLVLTPFAIVFLITQDPLYEDFFKFYGLFAGLALSVVLEERFVRLEENPKLWKKILRVVIGVVTAFALKEGLKSLFAAFAFSSAVPAALMFDALRYFLIALLELVVCPFIFKKVNI